MMAVDDVRATNGFENHISDVHHSDRTMNSTEPRISYQLAHRLTNLIKDILFLSATIEFFRIKLSRECQW